VGAWVSHLTGHCSRAHTLTIRPGQDSSPGDTCAATSGPCATIMSICWQVSQSSNGMLSKSSDAGAKIAFFDLSADVSTLSLPWDLVAQYYGVQYEAGARVHSDSWGVRAE
jgi:hypothetical protein